MKRKKNKKEKEKTLKVSESDKAKKIQNPSRIFDLIKEKFI